MEALYSALEGEISTFMKHTQRCQEGFDLHSLYHVLLLVLPQSPLGQVESWQHLHRFAHCQPGLASPDMASSYVDWLASYLQHPSTLKERFDARVVVSLCENLYVHEEPAACPTQRSPLASIPHLAGQLFAHQHNWGLLLKGGALSQRVFSPQSLHDLHGFADVGPFVKVLRLVPDVFHQSLATADLAQKWVSLHHNRYGHSLPPSASLSPSLPLQPPAWSRAGLAPAIVQPPPCSRAPQKPNSPLGLPNPMIPPQPSGTGSHPSCPGSSCFPAHPPPAPAAAGRGAGAGPALAELRYGNGGLPACGCPGRGAAEESGAGGVPPQHPGG